MYSFSCRIYFLYLYLYIFFNVLRETKKNVYRSDNLEEKIFLQH